jgi:hypothetical protein
MHACIHTHASARSPPLCHQSTYIYTFPATTDKPPHEQATWRGPDPFFGLLILSYLHFYDYSPMTYINNRPSNITRKLTNHLVNADDDELDEGVALGSKRDQHRIWILPKALLITINQ